MRSFDILGSVAIVKFPRGTSIVDKKKYANKLIKNNNGIKTVLEKVGKFKGRLRKMETNFVAGERTKEILYRENGCVFRFNIDKTYFSPRLSNERKEIADAVKKKDKVLVMFAGAAPYSIVIAKKTGAEVWSNEINKEANKYGKLNAELNGLKSRIVFLDGDIKKIAQKLSHPPTQNLHSSCACTRDELNRFVSYKRSPKARDLNLNVNTKQNRGYVNNLENNRAEQLREGQNSKLIAERSWEQKRDKLLKVPRYFDVIIMPRPWLKDSFLKEAFSLSKKGTRIFYYDFCAIDEKNKILNKIKQEAKNSKKKIKIIKSKVAGEIAPYKVRLRVDFRII